MPLPPCPSSCIFLFSLMLRNYGLAHFALTCTYIHSSHSSLHPHVMSPLFTADHHHPCACTRSHNRVRHLSALDAQTPPPPITMTTCSCFFLPPHPALCWYIRRLVMSRVHTYGPTHVSTPLRLFCTSCFQSRLHLYVHRRSP
ncbi:hypothetical protein BD310DRAFT_405064 [Dichomitus squalens]|uniref:C2H2-type domain-containing protein n=1 Tax=Dichomitus squalens TaxID=114155 RepID=A0A4Q9QAC0_9APHY|nr:hypothetical protein BD310DRAFT_405064 [Dichomitus squalens]